MIQVVPAIIPVNKRQLEEEINRVSHFANLVQVDISDGVFTSTRTWPYNGQDMEYFEELKKETTGWPKWEDVIIELHLMVENPENVLNEWIQTGVTSVVVHIEATQDFQKIVDMCKEKEISLGVAIKPNTDIEKINDFVSQTDFIQVMGSNQLGKHGVELEEKSIDVVRSLRAKYPDSIIAIDIGVNTDTAEILVEAGCNKLISGGAILNSDNPKETYEFF